MARIVIESPLFDLKQADGTLVPAAQGKTPDELAKLQLESLAEFVGGLQKVLQGAAAYDAGVAVVARVGLVVAGEIETEEATLRLDALPVPPPQGRAACYKCGEPPATWQIRCLCTKHGQKG